MWTDTCCIAPLHTGLDEGKWPFNRHDSLFDWELCPKATTVPASKASRRLCSTSSSPSRCCYFGLFLQCSPSMSKSCWHPEIGLPVSFVPPAPPHPSLMTVPFITMRSHASRGHDLYTSTSMCMLHCCVKPLPHYWRMDGFWKNFTLYILYVFIYPNIKFGSNYFQRENVLIRYVCLEMHRSTSQWLMVELKKPKRK